MHLGKKKGVGGSGWEHGLVQPFKNAFFAGEEYLCEEFFVHTIRNPGEESVLRGRRTKISVNQT